MLYQYKHTYTFSLVLKYLDLNTGKGSKHYWNILQICKSDQMQLLNSALLFMGKRECLQTTYGVVIEKNIGKYFMLCTHTRTHTRARKYAHTLYLSKFPDKS